VGGVGFSAWQASATDESAPAAPAATPAAPAAAAAPGAAPAADAAAPPAADAAAGGACCKPDDSTPPLDLIKATPKGQLKNPYADKIADAAFNEAAHKRYLSYGCNGCHGGGGGGGMCPPLTNDTWVYGPDDDTLFRLIALGSDGLQKDLGYKRVKQEVVVGPMPPFGGIIKTSDEMWKVVTYIRSVNPSSATKPPLQ
ncbi:MAG TPA: c-type cytochrome, partial [Methyloceanibacter sp.]|nr:c-type cytochrome [Methyloceanibacter sp.]